MKDAMMDASKSEVRKTRVKPKIIKEGAIAKGLEALAMLESSDVAIKSVQPTARTFVQEAIETILRLRAKGVPLLRIYNDARKATGLRIGYQTFAGYVSEISREKGLRPANDKTEAGAMPRPGTEREPAPAMAEALSLDEETASTATCWQCSRCEAESTRTEKEDGKAWWRCPACRTFYKDIDGQISSQRLNAKREG